LTGIDRKSRSGPLDGHRVALGERKRGSGGVLAASGGAPAALRRAGRTFGKGARFSVGLAPTHSWRCRESIRGTCSGARVTKAAGCATGRTAAGGERGRRGRSMGMPTSSTGRLLTLRRSFGGAPRRPGGGDGAGQARRCGTSRWRCGDLGFGRREVALGLGVSWRRRGGGGYA
jgi:hypothetical protein